MNAPGFNPLRWLCDRDGCFNQKRRPKIEMFAECFPGRINFGDVDGLVEYGGYYCLLEWKGDGGAVGIGQRLTYERWSKMAVGNIVFIVNGDAETMAVKSYSIFWDGKRQAPHISDLSGVKARIRAWVQWVDDQRRAIA